MPRAIGRLRQYDEAVHQRRLWTPKLLGPSLIGWWDANDSSSLTMPNDAANPNGVSVWADKSGYGRNFAQSTISQRPTLSVGGFGGRNSIKFTRSLSQCLDLSNFPTSGITQLGVYIVVDWLTIGTTINDGTQVIIDNANNATTGWVFQDRPDIANKPLQIAYNPAPSTPTYGAIDTANTGNDVWKVLGGVFVGGASGSASLYDNDNLRSSVANPNTLTLNSQLRLGSFIGQNSRFFNGAISEIIIVSDATGYTRQKIAGYLAWNNRLNDSLFSTNPFLSRPPMIRD